ncbi:MAG TPA: hypothetical protein VGM67_00645 [Gemmatimonadaceae bacterium]|jgi:hypothetical protein
MIQSPLVRYVAATIAVVLVVGAVMSFAFHGPNDTDAIWLSGVVAVVVQLAAARVGQAIGRDNLTGRMAIGALFRFLSLVIYAVLVALVLKLPIVAALLSLFVFFFLSTLIEPLLIRS